MVDLAVFGNLLLDDIVYTDGETRMGQPGGAALYVALGASLWPVSVGIVSRVGDDYSEELITALGERRIDLTGIRPTGGPTMRTWLLYEGQRRRVVHRLGGPTHKDVSPTAAELPDSWKPRAVHFAPMPWVVQERLIGDLSPHPATLLSADPYELLTKNSFDSWRRLFSAIDLLFLSEDEMTIPGALDSPIPILEQLGPPDGGRLASILYKRGALGGIHLDVESGKAREWSSRSREVLDPTGAGDALAGGVLAGRLLGDSMKRALDRGVVSASFALEAEGADGLFAATREAASDRLLEWFGLTRS